MRRRRLRLLKCVVTIQGEPEEAIKLVKIEDATDSCTVAFIDRVSASDPKVIKNINKFAQVVEINKDSTNTHKRRMAKQNYGMATIFFSMTFQLANSQELVAIIAYQ
jgi:hypothetical protein